MKGECFRVKSEKMMAGLQHFSLSKGFEPIGAARASRKAISTGLVGRGVGLIQRIFSGDRSLLPPNWSRTERLTVLVKATVDLFVVNLRIIELGTADSSVAVAM